MRIDYHASLKLLVAVRGHAFDRRALDALFAAMPGVAATMVDQPAAGLLMNPDAMAGFDALVLYDMPGLDFSAKAPVLAVPPDARTKTGLEALLRSGKGVLALHHALAGWPDWDEYGEWLGGRFLYAPRTVRGQPRLDSGYRHKVSYRAEAVTPGHPVTAGLEHGLTLTDELYLAEIFEDDVIPLLRAQHDFVAHNFWSSARAIAGRRDDNDGWAHPPASTLIGWAKRALASPLVYLQPGDDATTFAQPEYRRLVENAVRWVASDEALAWARKGQGASGGWGLSPQTP
ncbi:ThuA domain-containing protein [Polymorphobacter sp.]|uniref:ThuA domain-containing protein n=1 Tax=Polymorphobacter sp. TaxID=1909290 RepID=UPI003F709847